MSQQDAAEDLNQGQTPAHRLSDESRWCAPKGAVSLVSRAKFGDFPPKL